MTSDEKRVAAERIRRWPREEIRFAASLTVEEQETLAELAAALDIRPVPPDWEPSPDEILIDLR